jgi:hypothetical protein
MEETLLTAERQRQADDAEPWDWGPLPVEVEPVRLTYDETIDHLCYAQACCNPDHWVGMTTRAQNTKNARKRK